MSRIPYVLTFITVLLCQNISFAQLRTQNVLNLRKASIDSVAVRRLHVGGTSSTFSQADSELTVKHGTHIKGGLKVDGVISGTVAAANPFLWSVTGSSAVSDSLRCIPGAGILQSQAGNTIITSIDSNATLKSAGHTIKSKAASAAFAMTASDVNANTSTTGQTTDTSAFSFSFTGTGKPMMSVVGNSGAPVFTLDSIGRIGVGVTPGFTMHSQYVGASSVWTNDVYGNNSPIPIFIGRQAGGTPSTPSATTSTNTLARFSGAGHSGSAATGSKGIIDIAAAENWSESGNGTMIKMWTTRNGTTSVIERIRIDDQGNVGIGNTNPKVMLDVTKGFALRDSTVSMINTNINDYPIGAVAVLRISSDASRTITGFNNGVQGRILYLVNVGLNNITISNQSSASQASNRIITGTGADIILGGDKIERFWYDASSQRWRKI